MSEVHPTRPSRARAGFADRLGEDRPDVVFMAPMVVYLLLLGLKSLTVDSVGHEWVWVADLIRGLGAAWVVWLFRKNYAPWGRPEILLAIAVAAVSTVIWAAGQHLFNAAGVPQRLPIPLLFTGQPDSPEKLNPFNIFRDESLSGPMVGLAEAIGVHGLAWLGIVTRILVATTTVAFVEEIFWRAFLLRALINWNNFEKIPLGTFQLRAFVVCALVSVLEHPDNWAVSIVLWLFWNALMVWRKSLLFMILVHGLTNLFLYSYVVAYNDWMFW
jgi:membrane protease YdiL (CAAX protease family)